MNFILTKNANRLAKQKLRADPIEVKDYNDINITIIYGNQIPFQTILKIIGYV